MSSVPRQTMIEAMRSNDKRYNGRFYVGVHSTGIYCLPSCKAKLPLLKNVVFYDTREEAIAAGLRGCKRCKSETYPDVLPQWLHRLLTHMRTNRNIRLTERDLTNHAGVNISTIRRHFKEHLSTTPAAFHRRQRLLYARDLMVQGESYVGAAFAAGWESSSGFRDAYIRQFGQPPTRETHGTHNSL